MLEIDKYRDRYWKNAKGCFHRIDGPAVEYNNGGKHWCLNGQLHRMDGPAIEDVNGDRWWYLDGVEYTKEEYKMKVRGLC